MTTVARSALDISRVTDIQTLTGSNATVVVPIFRLTGSIQVIRLYAVVTTVLGSNVTAAYWRFNDQTAQTSLTLSTGTALSAAAVGSLFAKITTNGTALTLLNASAGRLSETAANHMTYQEFILTAKNGANSDIEFVYTTTNTPTSGVIQFFLDYKSLSDGSNAAPL